MIFRSTPLYLLVIVFLFLQCARNQPPSGGETYTSAFYVQGTYPKNLSTFLSKDISIYFQFSDWVNKTINIQDILINPALPQTLDFSITANKLRIDFRDPLLANQTFIISLRKSLKSVHNKTLTKLYTFIFSTGKDINRAVIKGHLTTNSKNNSKTYLGLYPYNTTSSDILNVTIAPHHQKQRPLPNIEFERPYYTIPVDSLGNFNFKWIQSGYYSLIGFTDLNDNLRPDIEEEPMGVGSKKIWLGDSSQNFSLNLKKLQQNPIQVTNIKWFPFESHQHNFSKGALKITFNQPILKSSFNPMIRIDSSNITYQYNQFTWDVSNQNVFLYLEQPILKEKLYYINLQNIFSLSHQKIDSNQIKYYFQYDSLFFTQLVEYTPHNFSWKESHLPANFHFIFESNIKISNKVYDHLHKYFKATLDTTEISLFWQRVDNFHFSVTLKKFVEKGQKIYFSNTTKNPNFNSLDTASSKEFLIDTLGFAQYKKNDQRGTMIIHLPKIIHTQEPTKWLYLMKSHQTNKIFIDSISNHNRNVLLDTITSLDIGSYSLSIFYDENKNNLLDPGSVQPWVVQENYINISSTIAIQNNTITIVKQNEKK